jgi:uncharacterized protein
MYSDAVSPAHRLRALFSLAIAIAYFMLAEFCARHVALALLPSSAYWLGYEFLRLLLLLAGYTVMGRLLQQENDPLVATGWARTANDPGETLTGIGLGWAMVLALVIPIALFGRLLITFHGSANNIAAFVVVLLTILLGAAAGETAFRGYPFQRLVEAVGPVLATVALALLFGFLEWHDIGMGAAVVVPTMLLQVLLCIAYLRTGSLWMSVGIHFAWIFTMGALFGLPVSGVLRYTTAVDSDPHGPVWLTGSFFGPAGSVLAPWVLLIGIFILIRLTRRDVIAAIRPAGIPMDLESLDHPEHPKAAAAPAAPALIQILPSTPPPSPLPFPRPLTPMLDEEDFKN